MRAAVRAAGRAAARRRGPSAAAPHLLLLLLLLLCAAAIVAAPFCAVCPNGGSPPFVASFLQAQCADAGAVISAVAFASYGTPTGVCPGFAASACNAATSRAVVEAACLGQRECRVYPNSSTFPEDPCVNTLKSLAVELTCTTGEGTAICGIDGPQPGACAANIGENMVAALGCPAGGVATGVAFASFGAAEGSCVEGLRLRAGACHAANSSDIVAAACVGQSECELEALDSLFGDPCLGQRKHLSVQLECSPNNYVVSDSRAGPVFDGVGAAFTGGSARLLAEYPEPQRGFALDYLFAPSGAPSSPSSFKGAALGILKLEVGGDGNAGGSGSDGSEPSHAHSADDAPDAGRTFTGWLAREALARNPLIKVLVTPVCWPAWLRGAPGGPGADDPFEDSGKSAGYVAQFVDLFQTRWGVRIGFVGVWASARGNVSASADDARQRAYVLALRAALDARGLRAAQVVCADGGAWGCAELLDASSPATFDPSVSAAVGVLGNAGRPPGPSLNSSASRAARPVWMTSYTSSWSSGPQPALNSGALAVSNEWMEGYISSGGFLGGFIYAFGLTAVPYGFPSWSLGLAQAAQPWSGHAFAALPTWAMAHVNQFVGAGAGGAAYAGAVWRLLPVGAGSGRLAAGGTYVCLVETALGRGDWACVIAKLTDWAANGDGSNMGQSQAGIVDELATFTLADSLRLPASGAAECWMTDWALYRPMANLTLFQRQADVPVSPGLRSFTLALAPRRLYTVTSVSPSQAALGCSAAACEGLPPAPTAFGERNLTFSGCTTGAPGQHLASIYGTFECVRDDAALGGVLRQTAVGVAVGDTLGNETLPHALAGDLDAADIDVSTAVFFDADVPVGVPAAAALLGARVSPWTATARRGVAPELAFAQAPGVWLRAAPAAGGGLNWSVSLGLDAASQSGAPVLAGVVPGVRAAGAWVTLRLIARGGRVLGSAGGALLFNADLGALGAPSTGFVGLATGAFARAGGPAFRSLVVSAAATTCDAVPVEGALVDVEVCQAGAAGQRFVFVPTGEYTPASNYYRRISGVDAVGADSGIAMPGTLATSYDDWRAACDADTTPGSPPGTFCAGFSSTGLAKLSLADVAPSAAGADGAPLTDLFVKTLPAGQLKLAANSSLCLDATPGDLRLLLRLCDDPAKGPVFGTQMWQVERTLTDGVVVNGVITSGRAGPFTGAGVADIYGLVRLDLDSRLNIQTQGYNGGSNQIFDFDSGGTGLIRASHLGVCIGACRASA